MALRNSKRRDISNVAVGYIRRSTSKQEKSLVDQRREIEFYAERQGYSIIRWYEDDGVSGDATDKRVGFLCMHRDACDASRDFELILCWDFSRFGRFDSIEAGHWIHPLRIAGARLETVAEGRIDWNDFTGRIVNAIQSEGKHQFLRDLSRNTARGMITNARKGYSCGQAAPYGYDRMLIDESGNHRQRLPNGEQYAKPRSWRVTWVPSADQEKVSTLKWLFETYAETDIGLRALADELNLRGLPGPGGGTWWIGTIREILKNEKYVGVSAWGKRGEGKYHRVRGGEIREQAPGEDLLRQNDESEWIVASDSHEALVERSRFDRVQKKLLSRKKSTTTHRSKHGDKYLLTGLLFCAHCGGKMYGTRKSSRKNGKTYYWENYVCSTYHTQGKHCCGHHTVDQQSILSFLIGKLRTDVLGGGHMESLRSHLRRMLEGGRSLEPGRVDQARQKVAELDKSIQQGAKRLLQAPDDIADLLAAELSSLRRERDRCAAELAALERTEPADIDEDVEEAVGRLWTMAEELENAEPRRIRELIRRVVDRIDLWFDSVQQGKRRTYVVSRGQILLCEDPIFSKIVSRGDWI